MFRHHKCLGLHNVQKSQGHITPNHCNNMKLTDGWCIFHIWRKGVPNRSSLVSEGIKPIFFLCGLWLYHFRHPFRMSWCCFILFYFVLFIYLFIYFIYLFIYLFFWGEGGGGELMYKWRVLLLEVSHVSTQIAKTVGSTSIRYRSDTFASDRYLIDIDLHGVWSYETEVDQHVSITLQWRHNGRDSVSNQQPHGCLLIRLFRRRSKKTSKLRVTGLCAGNSPGPVNSLRKGPVTRKMVPFDDVIMKHHNWIQNHWIKLQFVMQFSYFF